MKTRILDIGEGDQATQEQAGILLSWFLEDHPNLYRRWVEMEKSGHEISIQADVLRFLKEHIVSKRPVEAILTFVSMRTALCTKENISE